MQGGSGRGSRSAPRQSCYSGENARGMRITERWELTTEGDQLLITTRIGGGPRGRRLSFRRVYDRQAVTGEPGPASDGSNADETPTPHEPEPNEGDNR